MYLNIVYTHVYVCELMCVNCCMALNLIYWALKFMDTPFGKETHRFEIVKNVLHGTKNYKSLIPFLLNQKDHFAHFICKIHNIQLL